MKTFMDSGFVLKATPSGESNKHVVLLLKNHGKVVVTAKGAQAPKSKLAVVTQPFSCCEFKVYQGAGFLSLAEGVLLDNFFNISADYDRFQTGCHILKLTDMMILPEMPARAALALLYKSLKLLCEGNDHSLVRSVFELKLLQSEGYVPVTDSCADCGAADSMTSIATTSMTFGASGLLCDGCAKGNPTVPIGEKCLQAINYILGAKTKDAFSFDASPEIVSELAAAASFFLRGNV